MFSKLLLRIYGPNVSHLIDRDSELAVLRRLARKRIGPRLLGTFTNGRFEEYFHARPLTPQDLRSPETSTQIAKRMRELHDGITLDEREITAGPFVWQNWNKWVPRCETIVKLLDRQPSKSKDKSNTNGAGLSEPVFICGVEWEKFRETVDRYRKWLEIQYGGYDQIQQRLVFAHNDVSLAAGFCGRNRLLITMTPDSVRQYSSACPSRGLPSTSTCKRAQAAGRDRFRIC